MLGDVSAVELAAFIANNRFMLSPYTALEILKSFPKAKFVRPLSYWLSNGYEIKESAQKIYAPLPCASFYFYRNNKKTDISEANTEELALLYSGSLITEEINFIPFVFYDAHDTTCRLRLSRISIDDETLFSFVEKLGLIIEFKPLRRMFLNSHLSDNKIILPTNYQGDLVSLVIKLAAEYVLKLTTTQEKEIAELELKLCYIMLNTLLKNRFEFDETVSEQHLNTEQVYSSLVRVSKLVLFLFKELGVENLSSINELKNCYVKSKKTFESKNKSKFKGLKKQK